MGHHKNTAAAPVDSGPTQLLSSLLLGKSAKKSGLDSALDDIFKTSVSVPILYRCFEVEIIDTLVSLGARHC